MKYKIFPHAYEEIIGKMVSSSSAIKRRIFDNQVKNISTPSTGINSYLSAVKSYLNLWDEYIDNITSLMKNGEMKDRPVVYPYNMIKKYIYGRPDYASILQVTSGLAKMMDKYIDEENIDGFQDDIYDFSEFTIGKAYDLQDISSTSGLIGDALETFHMKEVREDEKSMANIIKNIDNIFTEKDTKELYQAIEKTIHYLATADFKLTNVGNRIRFFILFLNGVFSYIQFSLSLYATRAFLIGGYVMETFTVEMVDNTPVDESTDEAALIPKNGTYQGSYDNPGIHIMQDCNFAELRDLANYQKLKETLETFLMMIGSKNGFKPNEYAVKPDVSNRFWQKLSQNPLYQFLREITFGGNYETSIVARNQELKALVMRNQHDLGLPSPKKALLATLRDVECDPTIQSIQSFMNDFYEFWVSILMNIYSLIDRVSFQMREFSYRTDSESGNKLQVTTSTQEFISSLVELYHDIVLAMIQRAQNIEYNYNVISAKKADEVINSVSIDIPGEMKGSAPKDYNDRMGLSVPVTIQSYIEGLDECSFQFFEALEMYDDYLRTIPAFQDNWYLSEAFDSSKIINLITSMIDGLMRQVSQWFGNVEVQNGFKWVESHKGELGKLVFTGSTNASISNIKNYKSNITLPDGYMNLKQKIGSADLKKLLSSESECDTFIKSLYFNDTVYGWWNGNGANEKDGAAKYKNWILFYDDKGTVKAEDPPLLTISGDDIKKYLNAWVATVTAEKKVYNGISSMLKDNKMMITSFKNDLNRVMSELNNQAKQNSNSGTGSTQTTTDQKGNVQAQPAQPNVSQNATADSSGVGAQSIQANANKLLTGVQLVYTRLYQNLPLFFIQALRDQYTYIQQAYNVAIKPNQNNGN